MAMDPLPPWVFVPPPRRPKLRRRPLSSKERGIDPVSCNGVFALPMEAKDSIDPIELELNKECVKLYNLAASIKLKSECENVTDERRGFFHWAAGVLNRQVRDIRTVCGRVRQYLHAANAKPINEPCALKRK